MNFKPGDKVICSLGKIIYDRNGISFKLIVDKIYTIKKTNDGNCEIKECNIPHSFSEGRFTFVSRPNRERPLP